MKKNIQQQYINDHRFRLSAVLIQIKCLSIRMTLSLAPNLACCRWIFEYQNWIPRLMFQKLLLFLVYVWILSMVNPRSVQCTNMYVLCRMSLAHVLHHFLNTCNITWRFVLRLIDIDVQLSFEITFRRDSTISDIFHFVLIREFQSASESEKRFFSYFSMYKKLFSSFSNHWKLKNCIICFTWLKLFKICSVLISN